MDKREQIINTWFEIWLKNDATSIDSIFDKNVSYSESWGPEYHGIAEVKHWFSEWNTRGSVLTWDIKRFIHSENTTVVERYFKNQMDDGRSEHFDGISLIEWCENNKFISLEEFGYKLPHYNPYEKGDAFPVLKYRNVGLIISKFYAKTVGYHKCILPLYFI